MKVLLRLPSIFFRAVLLLQGCGEDVVVLQDESAVSWSVVPGLARLDLRYVIEHQGDVYLVAVEHFVTAVCFGETGHPSASATQQHLRLSSPIRRD